MDRLKRESLKTLREMLTEKRDWLLELAVIEQEAWDSLPDSVRDGKPCFVADALAGAYEALDSGCEYISSVLAATDDGRG